MGNLGDLSPQGSVAIGVLVGVISTSLQAIGLTLQRKSHLLEDEKHPYDLRRPPYKRRRWQLGMLMFVVSNVVGSTIQITTLPLPVLSTLQASGLVFNTIFATLILGEAFTRYSLIGTILVCIGAVLIAIFGAIGEPAHSLDQLLELLQGRKFILWVAGTAVLVLIIFAGSKVLKALTSGSRSKHHPVRHSYAPRLNIPHSRIRLIRGLCYGLISGILSAHSLLLAKSAVELLVRTIVDRVNQFNRWQSWVILIAMIGLALSQLYFLHRGLKLCSTSVLYPFVFCIYNIIAILDGLIYFQQMSQLAGLHAGLVALGTIVLLAGVLCLSWRLEDIDSHVPVVGPSQATLGPGMAAVDEHAPTPLGLELEDEEGQIGEQEPLLHPLRAPHQRTPSLPLYSTFSKRSSTSNMDPASIWAELDDSDGEDSGTDVRSSLLARFSIDPVYSRPRSKSTALWGSYLSTGSGSQQVWSPRRIPPSVPEGKRQRRTSLPGPEYRLLLSKRRTFGPVSYSSRDSVLTSEPRGNQPVSPHARQEQRHSSPSNTTTFSGTTRRLLAGSRSALGAWRTGLQYLSRFTGHGRQREERDPEADPTTPSDSHSTDQ
ncbi:hypothetical protein ARAM_005863 [Aspergillus rambellii]|uniref:DUF803 domain protein n=1 Tax=Aspergillus rambellii TaxID=308745 RepID=A0A0F8WNL9_9EURO|nr:hypothetical protein ARAM_005863 [Aspergillus rambellii]